MLAPVREVLLRLISLATSQKATIADLSTQNVTLAQDKASLASQLAIELANNPAEQSAILAAQESARVAQTEANTAVQSLQEFQSQAAAEVEGLRSEITALLDQLAEAAGGNPA
jgi:hypothetical protein